MKPLLLDANILLRFVTGEPAGQANEVAELFRAAATGKVRLAVLPMVLAETVFVLTGFYEQPRAKVAEVLAHLLTCPGFDSDDQPQMLDSLQLFRTCKLDFVDCYLAAASLHGKHAIVTHDRALAKRQGVIARKPGAWL